MVDWKDPEVTVITFFVFSKMLVFILGGYIWYLVTTWYVVEWELIMGRLKFSWTHILYLLTRHGHLVSIIMSTTMVLLPTPIATSCRNLGFTRANIIIGNLTLVAASGNLSARAYTLWRDCAVVKIIMCLISIGHMIYAILIGAVSVEQDWTNNHTVCVLINLNMQRSTTGYYVYTFALDSLVLILTILGIRRQNLSLHSPLLHALRKQGVGYVFVTCLTCIPVAVTVSMDLNEIANVFLSVPSGTASVVASSAMVMALLDLKDGNDDGGRRDSPLDRPPGARKTRDSTLNQLTTNIDLDLYHDTSGSRGYLPEKAVDDVNMPSPSRSDDIELASTSGRKLDPGFEL